VCILEGPPELDISLLVQGALILNASQECVQYSDSNRRVFDTWYPRQDIFTWEGNWPDQRPGLHSLRLGNILHFNASGFQVVAAMRSGAENIVFANVKHRWGLSRHHNHTEPDFASYAIKRNGGKAMCLSCRHRRRCRGVRISRWCQILRTTTTTTTTTKKL